MLPETQICIGREIRERGGEGERERERERELPVNSLKKKIPKSTFKLL